MIKYELRNYVLLLVINIIVLSGLQAQSPALKQWDATFGGDASDGLSVIHQTSDGGYILAGYSYSGITGDKTQNSRGDLDYWIVKVNSIGVKQWDATFGGSGFDILRTAQQTIDGGYILGGTSNSPISGDKTINNKGGSDYWIIKVNSIGVKQWEVVYGGSNDDNMYSLQQTVDGGYILGGFSNSPISGDKTQSSKGAYDYWILKINSNGVKQWDATFGGSASDALRYIQQTNDNGFILGGRSDSPISGDKTQSVRGAEDFWIVKVDVNGNKEWDYTYGGSNNEDLISLQQTNDGGYILGGWSNSPVSGEKSQPHQGMIDYWVVKVNNVGLKQWDATFGGSDGEDLNSIIQTSDGGFLLGGRSYSSFSGDRTKPTNGSADYWIVKTNANGIKIWDQAFGGSSVEGLTSLSETSDGGYIFGGFSSSPISGDKSQTSRGGNDFWIVKTTSGTLPVNLIQFTGTLINNNSHLFWQTSSEENTKSFIVEHCLNAKDFKQIGILNAAGHSSNKLDYSFVDQSPETGVNYYRLKMVDKDGKNSYSTIVKVKLAESSKMFTASIYPNPTNDKTLLTISSKINARVIVSITDLTGKYLFQKTFQVIRGSNNIPLSLDQLPTSSYLCTIHLNGSAEHLKIVKH